VLRVGTAIYLAATALALRLPSGVDSPPEPAAAGAESGLPGAGPPGAAAAGARPPGSSQPGAGQPDTEELGPGGTRPLPRGGRGRTGLRRVFKMPTIGPIVREAMQANAALRAYSGFMIFFLAFILRTVHFAGTPDKLALGEMIAAAGIGGFIGTGIGSALRSRAPQAIVFGMLTLATITTALCAAFFGLWAALVVALGAALGQALVKLALDSILQREIGEEVRSSTFAVSETLHQLSWVAGGLAGLLMSLTNSGVAGLTFAAVALALALAMIVTARRRRVLRSAHAAAGVSSPVG
jgi:hypothetical protein